MMADVPAAHSSFMVSARSISVPGEAAAWGRLGFAVAGGTTQVGGVRIAFGEAEMAVAAEGMTAERPDGLALLHAREEETPCPPTPLPVHPPQPCPGQFGGNGQWQPCCRGAA